jgi:hypothetical protein
MKRKRRKVKERKRTEREEERYRTYGEVRRKDTLISEE